MLYFFDTSALVKRYHLEIGSPTVIQLFEAQENKILIASLSLAEFVSALNRIKNRGHITEADLRATLEKFATDISLGRIGVIDIKNTHITDSYEYIIKHNLSAADAIILTAALELREFEPIFVCADIRSGLLSAAISCHLSTLNPVSL